ncbi:MAG: CRISPR-associated helicase Cas3', partial [Sphingomonadaceae bacterium]
MTPEITMLWGKTDRSSGRYHPLLCHMLDVAAVAECLWDDVLPLDVRLRVARGLGVSEDVARAWIVLWAALHDLGKACPAFQSKDPNCLRRLAACGLAVQAAVREPAHGVVTALSLGELSRDLGLSKQIAVTAGMVAGGHHGVFPRSGEIADQRHHNDAIGGITWSNTRKAIVDALVKMLDTPVALAPQHVDGPTAMIVAGLISVADWIGSSEEHFLHLSTEPDRAPDLDPVAYLTRARDRARDALVALGWNAWPSAEGKLSFQQLFQHIDVPNSLQREAIRLADEIAGPALVVIEAPMGEGKTEAAMYLADRWAARSGRKGCYFALPTQATSDQMFARVRDFLSARYPRELVQLQLLHGHAALSAELAALKARSHLLRPGGVFGEPGYDGADAGVVAGEWFTHRKRGLLAPFGVGTVDQALLAVLQTRHVFVRLFGLAGKTVVVDEVHSYDAYMTELLDRLLEWLGALGCSVVLLSATLPRSRRTKLVAAYQRGLGMDQGEAQNTRSSYPRLTWTSASGSGTRPFETSRRSTKRLRIEWVDGRIPEGDEPFPLGERLKEALAEGGCAAVVCNTVRRAQTVYTALKRYFPEVGPDGLPRELDLLHARYPFEERERREQRALVRFGKPGGKVHMADGATEEVRRPRRAVLVSTQIVEQSLDLDFDLMVS